MTLELSNQHTFQSHWCFLEDSLHISTTLLVLGRELAYVALIAHEHATPLVIKLLLAPGTNTWTFSCKTIPTPRCWADM